MVVGNLNTLVNSFLVAILQLNVKYGNMGSTSGNIS